MEWSGVEWSGAVDDVDAKAGKADGVKSVMIDEVYVGGMEIEQNLLDQLKNFLCITAAIFSLGFSPTHPGNCADGEQSSFSTHSCNQ